MPRPINEIAWEITRTWHKPNFAAKPYLSAMFDLTDISDPYGADSGRSVVAYFLANAKGFRGDDARRLKAELNSLLKG
jgi:hypothetical protein